jgi:hypothetical protein
MNIESAAAPADGRRANGQVAGKTNGANNGEFESSLSLLESAVAEVKHLTAALAATQRQATLSQKKAEMLNHNTARLRDKLLRLTKLVEHGCR